MYHLPWWSDCCSFEKQNKKKNSLSSIAASEYWYGAIVAWCVMGPQWPGVLWGHSGLVCYGATVAWCVMGPQWPVLFGAIVACYGIGS